jgi:hypothetical protein
MRSHQLLRRVVQEETRAALGINPAGERRFLSQSHAAPLDAQVARLPVNITELDPLRDYATGIWFAMFDFSQFDGSDIFA